MLSIEVTQEYFNNIQNKTNIYIWGTNKDTFKTACKGDMVVLISEGSTSALEVEVIDKTFFGTLDQALVAYKNNYSDLPSPCESLDTEDTAKIVLLYVQPVYNLCNTTLKMGSTYYPQFLSM